MKIKKIGFVLFGVLLMASQAPNARALSMTDLQSSGGSTYTYPSASLVNDSGTIYFISGTAKVPFTNYSAFIGLGYSLNNVVNGDLSAYNPAQTYIINTAAAVHPWSAWLLYKNTVYYSSQEGLIGVPSAEVFTSNGGQWQFVVNANKYDIAVLEANPNLPVLTDNDSRVITAPAYQFSSTGASQSSGLAFPNTSNQSTVSQNAATGTSAQVSTGIPGTLNIPVLAPSSTPTQFVYSNATNQPIATYNFTATGGPVTIEELDFNVVSPSSVVPIAWVNVGGESAQFLNATATVTGLNISVPASGISVPVTVNYPNVAPNNVQDNQTLTLNLVGVKYISGGMTSAIYTNVASNSMDLVSTSPTAALVTSTQPLTDNTVLFAKVTVTAGPGNGIILNQLPLIITDNGGGYVVATSTNLVVTDDSGLAVQTSYNIFGMASGTPTTVNINFNSNNFIAANTSKTYDFSIPVIGALGNPGTASLVTQLGPASSLIYSDPILEASGGSNIACGTGGTSYILNYPTNSVSIHN